MVTIGNLGVLGTRGRLLYLGLVRCVQAPGHVTHYLIWNFPLWYFMLFIPLPNCCLYYDIGRPRNMVR